MALDEEVGLEFLQWFVKEQIEEENLNYLMDKITLAGGEIKGDALCIN
jgi:ferritin